MAAIVRDHAGAEIRECYDCGVVAVQRAMATQRFEYAGRTGPVTLEAVVPVWTCGACGDASTDGDGEILRHEAVCRHLGVLSPRELVALRKRLGLSQVALAELTGLDEASIERWESGARLQNEAADRLLRVVAAEGGRGAGDR